ncbi:ascorbate peroxidase 6, chloroplastic/mitochondrial [Seminavis robusta]|uniref:Ascorbate peroxidase 6, chloroplastic/mitochondrial n=1 Tax=Seminavis robusta TaxID=568900 RepID=A0A9N8DS21_9STRA|nr:ascorbate peroxidase 6, chloroplastic/mitochondrial [Seminavis robusta]|eukprot:Sro315_g115240.1 ascorbate peroxidase 6, chloroplastic/mitochondrial (346) ;mRNA; f:17073-18110
MKISTSSVLAIAASLASPAIAFTTTPINTNVCRRPLSALAAVSKSDLEGAQAAVDELLNEKNCGPIMIRLAWHDSGTFDKDITDEWPAAGGAVGSIRCNPELLHGANAGLDMAVDFMQGIKDKFPDVSYADLYQMASARAVALAGGPDIDMMYGRLDSAGPDECSLEGHLPDAEPGPDGKYGGYVEGKPSVSTEDKTPYGHLRKVFYRMGLNDEEIVALSGAHTMGRAHKDRSGLGAAKTKFTDGKPVERGDGEKVDNYRVGGSAWTKQWLTFDNSYFTTIPDDDADPELLKLSTDKTLFDDDGFKPFAEKFRDSQDAFFESYAEAHKKLSELGSKFEPKGGIKI